jgi:hypothetical protein
LNDFWTRFHVAKKWLNARRAEYRDTGGVKTLNGQWRFGVMTGNEPVITPIQNGEAVIVLDCQNELQKLAIEYDDMYLMPRINVHDDLTFILPDNEDRFDKYRAEIERVMTKTRYRWQTVPLIVEASVGYNWCDMEAIGTYEGDYVRGNVVPFRPPPSPPERRQPMARDKGRYRSTDPDTSRDAAERIDATAMENEVLVVVKRYGPPYGPPMCVVDIWKRLQNHPIDSISPRMKRLVEKGLVAWLGKEPRANRYDNVVSQNVYSAAPEDVAAALEARRAGHGGAEAEAEADLEEEVLRVVSDE